ncbi:MAG: YwbE family protein [Acidaminococcaceae bacterium]
MQGTIRSAVPPGTKVKVVKKEHQRTGQLTEGIVKDILTNSAKHPRGIKVRLVDGTIGRVQEIIS